MKLSRFYTLIALVIFALIAVIVYMVVRVSLLFLFSGYNSIEKIFSSLLIFAELFILVHGLGYILNILQSNLRRKKGFNRKDIIPGSEPAVAILVAARHEPRHVLEATFIALRNINYKNKDIFFLDDSSDQSYKNEAESLCKELGLKLFRRDSRHGAKAGIINDCIRNLNHKYIAVFDADQNPLPEFLNALIPILEADSGLAFVQTPQFYTNIEDSLVARGAAFQQAVFYEYICEGKSGGGSMFCCGTNVVFRAEALRSVGGLDESSITEDFATSLRLHLKGWKSVYYDHVYAFGMGPTNLTGYFKQQFRWAAGTLFVLRTILFKLITSPGSLNLYQWWEYILSGSYYFIGVSFAFLMLCPILYLLFRIPSFFVNPEIYFLSFLPYIMLSMAVFYTLLGSRHYKIKDLFIGQLLGVCALPVYVKAAVSALFGIRSSFGVTQKTKSRALPLIDIWPQLLFIIVDFIAIVWGINRYVYENEPAILINSGWATYHLFVMSGIFLFNKAESLNIACKIFPNNLKFEYKILNDVSSIEDLSRGTWNVCFRALLKEVPIVGTLVIFKILPINAEPIVFEARVLYSNSKPSGARYESTLGVCTVTDTDKDRLKQLLEHI